MAGNQSLAGRTVGISVSTSADFARLGFSATHHTAAMVEIARHVLVRGGRVAYGGDLRPASEGGEAPA